MYRFLDQYIGYPPIENLLLAANVPALLKNLPCPPGTLVTAFDPVWGYGEFQWGKASASIRQYGLVVFTPTWDSTNSVMTFIASECPNTTLLGRAVGISMNALSTGDYGWFLITGMAPVNCTASVAADTTWAIAAAGQGGALATGKQIVNSRIVVPATNTVAKAATGNSGDTVIYVANTDGFFLGGYLSGTGVGASAVISAIDPNGRYVVSSVANSAAVSGNLTQTANNSTIYYNIAKMNRSFAQGAIT